MYLNCKTYFSFHYGTYSAEELVNEGAEKGVGAMALTNINTTCDAWDFVQYCRDKNIKPILGVEIRNGCRLLYILLARNNRGFRWINEFLSGHLVEKTDFPEGSDGIPFFAGVDDGVVIYPLGRRSPAELLVNEYIGVLPGEVAKLARLPLERHGAKLVARVPVTCQNKIYYNLHRLLRAIDKNVLLSKLPAEEQAGAEEYFRSPGEVIEVFRQYPSIILNTYRLMDGCDIAMEFGKDKNKKIFSASKEDDRVLLEKLAREGLLVRYGRNRQAAERMTKELRIIDEMGFNAYFLITLDMIRYAQSRGFYHVGRGSGANSLVAYCLQITDVDPIELDLYFERFLNPERTSPPDFDIDFSYTDRDEVIDYLFKRYGKQYVALLGSYSTFQYNAIVRELGRVFGLPKEEIDMLAEKGYYNGDARGENFMKRKEEGNIQRTILQYGKLLQNFPDHLSIHAGGVLVSEEPLSNWCAVYMPPKGFATTQLDMFVAENIGLFKLDVLSQRGLGHIKECIHWVRRNKQIDINIHEVQKFMKDPLVRAQIRNVNTIGCFYIESPAMRHLLLKLHCDDYKTLVAASSIIRPGVGRSGMMQQYIHRFHHPDKFEYLHPKLKELLEETYGVMVYQEDVLKIAHYWAGMDMADADLLRRATSTKYRGKKHLIRLKEKFFANCRGFGYPEVTIGEVWRQIESFADFSFCKAHSASFAIESYQSLFLKTYYPMEFAVAVINNFGGFYSRELYFYELMKTGARVHPPCINNSDQFTNIMGEDAYVGFVHVKGLEQSVIDRLLEERRVGGPFLHLADFVERTGLTAEPLEVLIRVGALRCTGRSKKQLLWEGDFVQKTGRTSTPARQRLFKEAPVMSTLPDLPVYELDDIYDEVELLGFPVRDPFALVDDDPSRYIPARELPAYTGKTVTVLAYHITHKPVRTIKGETMSFGTFLDVNKDWIDTVHFPQVHAVHSPNAGFYRITGKVVEEFGVYSIEVVTMTKAGIRRRNEKEKI
jgi:DNA polymerase-3 subunit alpha